MSLKLKAHKSSYESQKINIVADVCRVPLDFEPLQVKSDVSGVRPELTTREGVKLCGSTPIAKHIARLRPDSGIYGYTLVEASSIDSWIDLLEKELDVPMGAMKQLAVDCSKDSSQFHNKVKDDVKKILSSIESHLVSRTYLVGECMTLADVSLACTVQNAIKSCCAAMVDPYPCLKRWFELISHHPVVARVFASQEFSTMKCGHGGAGGAGKGGKTCENKQPSKEGQAAKCSKGASSDAKSAESKPSKIATETSSAPAAKSAADVEAEIEAEAKAKAKAKNPLDELPPSTMDLDEWKRKYSNTKDLKGEAMPWFWEHVDLKGWTVWYLKYQKAEGEGKVGYTTANMLGGFFQRLDQNFRKYSFGVVNVLGKEGNFEIEGVMMVRGMEIPNELRVHPSFEYHTFEKLDCTDEKHKAKIADFWCNDEEIEGVKIEACKVWK